MAKIKAVGTLTGILARVDDAVERSYYVKMAASELGVECRRSEKSWRKRPPGPARRAFTVLRKARVAA